MSLSLSLWLRFFPAVWLLLTRLLMCGQTGRPLKGSPAPLALRFRRGRGIISARCCCHLTYTCPFSGDFSPHLKKRICWRWYPLFFVAWCWIKMLSNWIKTLSHPWIGRSEAWYRDFLLDWAREHGGERNVMQLACHSWLGLPKTDPHKKNSDNCQIQLKKSGRLNYPVFFFRGSSLVATWTKLRPSKAPNGYLIARSKSKVHGIWRASATSASGIVVSCGILWEILGLDTSYTSYKAPSWLVEVIIIFSCLMFYYLRI